MLKRGSSEYVAHGGQHAEAWIPLLAEYKSIDLCSQQAVPTMLSL